MLTVDKNNFGKLKVSDLKRELKSRGLNTSGNKLELVERLTEAFENSKNDESNADSVDEDDVLLDDEIDQEVDDMKNIELEVSDKSFETETDTPINPKATKRKRSTSSSLVTDDKTPSKKIVLNRELSIDNNTSTLKISNPSHSIPTTTTNGDESEQKKTVKLSELSAKERLDMRTKKFGTPLSVDAKKEARAERFGESNTTNSTSSPSITGKNTITFGNSKSTPTNMGLLKKRAERFGIVSKELLKVDNEEKMEKRKERFGTITTTATATNGASNDTQKAKRLERFKISLE